jgi:hypothetical protein
MPEFSPEDIQKILVPRHRTQRPSLREILLSRAKQKYPPNPFCSNTVSASLVREVLEEAGYKDFSLFIAKDGIWIEEKRI